MNISTLEIFIEVMRKGSFAAVARARGVAPSSISREIKNLEEELGLRLFQRSTRRLSATEAAEVYFARVSSLVDEARAAQEEARDLGKALTGTLRMTAPVSFAQLHLVPLLPTWRARWPTLSIELLLTDTRLDLLANRLDLAIRLGRLQDSSLVARRLCKMRYVLCASPSYLEQHGTPASPQDLTQAQCLVFPLPTYGRMWRFRDAQGLYQEIPVGGEVSISNALALRQCAVNGMGVAVLAAWVISKELQEGSLVPRLPDYEVTATEFEAAAWALYPSRAYIPRKTTLFLDFLQENISPLSHL